MNQPLQDLQTSSGATFISIANTQVAASFGNDEAALQAADQGVALYDRSHWGWIQVTGDDRLRFLHNQTTNAFQTLQPGQGCDTVFVTPTARTIDLVTAFALEDAVLLLTSPGCGQKLIQWMDRYIFFADKVELKDITHETAAFTLLGSASAALLKQLGVTAILEQPRHSHQVCQIGGVEVRVAVDSGLATPGYTLMTTSAAAAELWQHLVQAGAVPLGETAWEQLRIEQGRPTPGKELTEDYNPLEAGLWHTISLSKGCYIGQETIARLHTYKGVKQQLWGVRLAEAVEPNSPVMAENEKIGILTSCTPTQSGFIGLAYLRTKAIQPGLIVQIGESKGELLAPPFLSHVYP